MEEQHQSPDFNLRRAENFSDGVGTYILWTIFWFPLRRGCHVVLTLSLTDVQLTTLTSKGLKSATTALIMIKVAPISGSQNTHRMHHICATWCQPPKIVPKSKLKSYKSEGKGSRRTSSQRPAHAEDRTNLRNEKHQDSLRKANLKFLSNARGENGRWAIVKRMILCNLNGCNYWMSHDSCSFVILFNRRIWSHLSKLTCKMGHTERKWSETQHERQSDVEFFFGAFVKVWTWITPTCCRFLHACWDEAVQGWTGQNESHMVSLLIDCFFVLHVNGNRNLWMR